MLFTSRRLYCGFLIFIITATQLAPQVLAQADPGRDVFQLSPEQLQMFEGYQASSSASSLFTSEDMSQNGFFTTPNTQLGGAAPYFASSAILEQPTQTNVDTAQFIVLTSSYTPNGDLTKDSTIGITVKVKNVSDTEIDDIVLKGELQDKNATLVGSDGGSTPPFAAGSSIAKGLTWNKLETVTDPPRPAPFNLKPGASAVIEWSVKAKSDNDILRWRFTATFGAGESILLQWIPIKNPNPVAPTTTTGGSGGVNPCAGGSGGSGPFPDTLLNYQITPLFAQHWKINLVNGAYDYTDAQYHGLLKSWWEALTTVECTPYLQDGWMSVASLNIIADTVNANGWGYYGGDYNQHMNIGNIVNITATMMKQNLIHELGHVYEATPGNQNKKSDFEATINGHGSPNPWVSGYNGYQSPGDAPNEDFASAVGYYAIRDQVEMHDGGFGPYCPTKNPYDWGQAIYYNWVKANIYGGKEFGAPAPAVPGSC